MVNVYVRKLESEICQSVGGYTRVPAVVCFSLSFLPIRSSYLSIDIGSLSSQENCWISRAWKFFVSISKKHTRHNAIHEGLMVPKWLQRLDDAIDNSG